MRKKDLLGVVVFVLVVIVAVLFISRGFVQKPEMPREEDVPDGSVDRSAEQQVQVGDTGEPIEVGTETPDETHQQMLNGRLAELNMSPVIRTLLGLDGDQGDRDARRDALKKLSRVLSPDDAEALALFLDFRHEDHDALPSATFEALKNDALIVLLNQKEAPVGLGSQLADMFADDNHSTRWRDFSLQYLAQYYEEVMEPGSDEFAAITNTYANALQARSEKFAGTALMAVERLSRDHEAFDRDAIGDAAVEIALAADTSHDSRITALRVCAMMGRVEVLPQARMLSQTGTTTPVRLAAIATVGDLGDATDLEYIESLAASDDRRLQRVSKSASKRLRERLQSTQDADKES